MYGRGCVSVYKSVSVCGRGVCECVEECECVWKSVSECVWKRGV